MANKWKIINEKWKIQRAFTLVELLVVISIIGVLVTIGLVSFMSSQARGRDAARKSDLKQISSALELYYSDYGKYPTASSGEIAACPYDPSAVPPTGAECVWGQSEFSDTKTTYFKVMPKDPVSSHSYLYRVDTTGQKFQLFANLENTQDINLITPPLTNIFCGGTTLCNFAITSPNTKPTDIY